MRTAMISTTRRLALRWALVLTALSAVSGLAAAQTEAEETIQVIPYDGILEIDGVPANGDHILRFALYVAASDPEAVWTGEVDVDIVGGRFSTLLGRDGSLPADIFQYDDLYLALAIEDPDEEDHFFDLVNRQRIVPTPFSYIAAEAGDFHVRGALTVDGQAMLGTLTAQDVDTQVLTAQNATVEVLTVGANLVVQDLLAVSASFVLSAHDVVADKTLEMTPVANSACFLTRVHHETINNYGEYGNCMVVEGTENWLLRLQLGNQGVISTSDGNLVCTARCISW